MYKSSTKDRQPPGGVILPPPIAAMNQFLPPAAAGGTAILVGAGKVATEWLSFVYRRLGEDAQLLGQLATSKSPAEFWALCADFQKQAVRDYWQEYAALTRLASDNVSASLEPGPEPKQRDADTSREAPAARAA
jgi:hypothetical protein